MHVGKATTPTWRQTQAVSWAEENRELLSKTDLPPKETNLSADIDI